MRPPQPHHESDHRTPPRRRDYSLFYFQQQDGRAYLRFTLLGVIAIVLLILIPITALLIFFFTNSNTSVRETNVNITPTTTTPYSANAPVLRMPPTPLPAKRVKQPTLNLPTPATLPTAVNNANQPIVTTQTPQPQPSASPP
jgi:cytoskeletal protein RodZ